MAREELVGERHGFSRAVNLQPGAQALAPEEPLANSMLRDKSLIPLSHQHQRALALCVRIDRAQPISATDMETWQSEIEQSFEQEIRIHFSAEEQVVFPAAREFAELIPLLED